MIAWEERSSEIAYLFNPAFCGTLLATAAESFCSLVSDGMPLEVAFLPLPIVLHEETREKLPNTVTTSLVVWLQRHPEVRVGLAERVRSLVPFTREAILFMYGHGYLSFDSGSILASGKSIPTLAKQSRKSEDIRLCKQKAGLVGRMLARVGDPLTIYATLGVRP